MEREDVSMQDIKLTILVPTYNQENYIEECINSILKQKIDFEFEVLIGEDCSTDNTADILRKLEPELPENFKIYYREKNLGIGAYGNIEDLVLKSHGKYITQIEGDDFLTYDLKIQKQIEFLEANPEYVAVAHNCIVVDKWSKSNGEIYVECKDEQYTYEHYLNDILPGQTTSTIYLKEYYKYYNEFMDKYKLYDFYPGDRLRVFLLLSMGKIKCIQEPWSAYRHITTEGSSYSATVPEDEVFKNNQLLFFKSLKAFAEGENKRAAIIPAGKLYYMFLFKKCVREHSWGVFMQEILSEKHSVKYLFYVLRRGFRYLLKKMSSKID